jgi:hypothetical protein
MNKVWHGGPSWNRVAAPQKPLEGADGVVILDRPPRLRFAFVRPECVRSGKLVG